MIDYYSLNKKLANKANARIRNLRKLTEIEEPFSVKQLMDKLSSDIVKGRTKSGLVSIRKNKTELQQKAINRALKEFLDENSISSVGKAKKYRQKVSKELGKPVTYKQANVTFQARKDYKWIYEYMEASDYWSLVEEAKNKKWDFDTFSQEILKYILNATVDEDFKEDLRDLYKYSLYGD